MTIQGEPGEAPREAHIYSVTDPYLTDRQFGDM